jgi:cobalt-zinc-cadmium efflux system membrane fusion protein
MTRVMTLGLCMAIAVAGGCRREAAAPPDAELPTLDVTSWTEKTELFMEYPPLVAGQSALFAVHLTRLSDFSAMTAGRPRIEFTPESGGSPVVLPGNEPSRPGVFRVEGAAPSAGRYQWAIVVDAPGLADRHELGAVTIFANEAAAIADAERHAADDPAAISYLKEQQWTNGFATVLVREADVRRAIRVPAVIEPLTGGEAVVSAPAAGRFMSGSLPGVGTRVTAGEELGRLQPRASEAGADRATLDAAVSEAQAAVDAARAEQTRAERLLAERAVPGRRVEDAQRAVRVAEARLTAAQARLAQRDEALRTGGGAASGNSFVLRAPIAGVVAEIFAALGASYDEGAPLFRIVRTDHVELQAHVPAADAPLGSTVDEIAVEIPGRPDPLVVEADHMHYAGIIDPKTRALPVQFDVDNRAGQLLIGQTLTAILYTGRRERMTTVQKEAVLMEAGRPYVFVQTGGESFSRRFIEIATRDGDVVGIRTGVKPGERVVTRGAYDVQLASAAGGLPAEGHVH